MFIVIPVGMNYQTRRLPIVTFTLIGLNVLVYLVSLVFTLSQGKDAALWIYEHLWLIPADSAWHTYLTSMFVHAGFFHLLGNMLYLFLFGCCVEDIIGRWRFATLYLLSGLVAELAYIAGTPEHFLSEIPMGGASGAISACMGAYLLLRARVKIDFKYFALIFFRVFSGDFSMAAWIVITFWFLKDVFFAVLSYYVSEGGGGVAFGAHVGGFLAGMGMIGLHKLLPPQGEGKKTKHGPMRVTVRKATPVAAARVPAAMETEQPTLFVYQGETQYGPYNLFQIQQMMADGSVTPEAQYWSEGMTEWRSIAELADGVSALTMRCL
jgi:membrane associated rhomboid family serine protease